MDKRYEHLVFSGSPFVMGISNGFCQSIVHQVGGDQSLLPWMIANNLQAAFTSHIETLWGLKSEISRKFGSSDQDLFWYMIGFNTPLPLISAAVIVEQEGPLAIQKEIYMVPPTQGVEVLKSYLRSHTAHCHELFLKDATCLQIFDHVMAEPFSTEVYYQLGVQCSREAFSTCYTMVKVMIG